MHSVVENELGGFDFLGPIWKDQAEKQRAPDTMRTWIREHRPHRLAVVGEAFAVDRPTENERSLPPSQNPRRRHVVDVWLFERGRPGAESWEADVLTREDGLIHLSDWRAFAMPGAIQNGLPAFPIFGLWRDGVLDYLRRINGDHPPSFPNRPSRRLHSQGFGQVR